MPFEFPLLELICFFVHAVPAPGPGRPHSHRHVADADEGIRVVEGDEVQSRGDARVFYPGWCPQIDWKKALHFGGTTVTWFDRWTLEAVLLPAFEHCAAFGMPMHFGEFGVIGYANAKSPRSAFCWTRDTVETFEKTGADWHLWNQGFGLRNAHVRQYIESIW